MKQLRVTSYKLQVFNITFRLLLVTCYLLLVTSSYSQYLEFGQNKVQYKGFKWKTIETDVFSIIYYQGEEEIALFAKGVLEDSYERYKEALSHTPSEKIPVIIYKSHNDFEQTNVTLSLIEESVGGFTEMYKNRVVVPFTGSYEDFRHVLAHELVHTFQFDIMYGSGLSSILPKGLPVNVPLWFIEGMAEYSSLNWNSEADMIIRDAIYYDKLFPIQKLDLISGSYLMYKEGQSIVKFIADRYGEKKIGEIFRAIKLMNGFNGAIKSTIGIDTEELNRLWTRDLRERYWPVCAEKEEYPSYARRLTTHKGYAFNIGPAISPDGAYIAFFSDRDQYEGIYLASAIDGKIKKKLCSGGKTEGFESLHILYGGITWNPDGTKICFVSEKKGRDYLYIMDVNKKKVLKKLSFEIDAIFSPSWSPNGKEIVFRGLKDGQADIYKIKNSNLKSQISNLERLTDDRYDDITPSWSSDGEYIVFASDRPIENRNVGGTFLSRKDYGEYGLFKVDKDGVIVSPVMEEKSSYVAYPLWIGKKILFISNRTGINNLYLLDLETEEISQLTDVIGGVFTPSISKDGKYLAFSIYTDSGWDIFTIKFPDKKGFEVKEKRTFPTIYTEVSDSTILKGKKLGLRFTPDWVGGYLSYSTEYGMSGDIVIALSDILGNHRIYLETNSPEDLTDANLYGAYWYLPKRLDIGGAIFREKYSYYYIFPDIICSENIFGGGILLQYPLSRFRRIEAECQGYQHSYKYFYSQFYPDSSYYQESLSFFIPSISFVTDNTIWGSTGPINGQRLKFTFMKSLPLFEKLFDEQTLSYNVYKLDIRRYTRFAKRYTLARRYMAEGIWGEDEDYYYIPFGGPEDLRGYNYREFEKRHIGLFDIEFRFPLIDAINLAFPIRYTLRGIRGAMFIDVGYAENDLSLFRPFKDGELYDLKACFGAGLRIPLSYMVCKLDFAWHLRKDFALSDMYIQLSFSPEY